MRTQLAVEAALARLAEAHRDATSLTLPEHLRDFDPRWLETELDRWVRMPAKIAAATQLGRLELAVYWDQVCALRVYPRASFETLATVLAYYRHAAATPSMCDVAGAQWAQLFPRGASLAQSLVVQRARWAAFVAERSSAEIDGALLVDLGAVLRETACHWTGHWTFDDVVLDRYAGDEIDFAHYISTRFHAGEQYERFVRFAQQMQSSGMTREKTWSLFTPSGERTFALAAVLAMDGNTDALLLEGADAFVELCAMGS